jgi:hypothetical protein
MIEEHGELGLGVQTAWQAGRDTCERPWESCHRITTLIIIHASTHSAEHTQCATLADHDMA